MDLIRMNQFNFSSVKVGKKKIEKMEKQKEKEEKEIIRG